MQPKFSALIEKSRAFEERFTPSIEEFGSSELYFDFQNQCSFYPTPQQLRECMDAYTDMIRLAASLTQTRDDSGEATSQKLFNSELLLGYLERSQPDAILACKDVAQPIADSAKYLLVMADDPFLDQNGRLISLGQLLAQYAGVEVSYRYEDSEDPTEYE